MNLTVTRMNNSWVAKMAKDYPRGRRDPRQLGTMQVSCWRYIGFNHKLTHKKKLT